MPKKEEEKQNKVEVDKEFLDQLLKSNTEMREKMTDIEGKLISLPPTSPAASPVTQDDVFYCAEVVFLKNIPPTPEDLALQQQTTRGFRTKLEQLMRECRVGSVQAIILKKLT